MMIYPMCLTSEFWGYDPDAFCLDETDPSYSPIPKVYKSPLIRCRIEPYAISISLLLVCKLIYEEAIHVLYDKNVFCFGIQNPRRPAGAYQYAHYNSHASKIKHSRVHIEDNEEHLDEYFALLKSRNTHLKTLQLEFDHLLETNDQTPRARALLARMPFGVEVKDKIEIQYKSGQANQIHERNGLHQQVKQLASELGWAFSYGVEHSALPDADDWFWNTYYWILRPKGMVRVEGAVEAEFVKPWGWMQRQVGTCEPPFEEVPESPDVEGQSVGTRDTDCDVREPIANQIRILRLKISGSITPK